MKRTLIFCFLIILCTVNYAQDSSNIRNKEIDLTKDSIQLDSLLILPATIRLRVNEELLDSSYYKLNLAKGIFIPTTKLKAKGNQAQITYRVFNYKVNQVLYKHHLNEINKPDVLQTRRYTLSQNHLNTTDEFSSQLNKQGSYTRGLSLGNNQDVVSNSNLNLQLSGKLSENVNILAAITDDNIPIQPDGNTQQIQDFDRIFIKLFNDEHELTLGDYQIENSKTSHFLRFKKKVQGGQYQGMVSNGKKRKVHTQVSASITKGKFNRMEIQGLEGNQGPYRLSGANNETYIIVLAGSEKIYKDGKLLSRGENEDYTINYNTAELSFNTSQPINRNARIIAEFEYSEENYSRYLIYNSTEIRGKKACFQFNFYNEQDNKNNTLSQNLSDEQKLLLSQVGDNLQNAITQQIQIVEFTNDLVLYKKETQQVEGIDYETYVYSTQPEEAIYKIRFSYVGDKKGNYRQIESSANGRVYEWVAPINSEPQGDFSLNSQMIAPEKHQLISFGGQFRHSDRANSQFELAFSNKDINTYSSTDDQNNKALAFNFETHQKFFQRDSNQFLNSSLIYNYLGQNFEEVEKFKSPEFNRDWNIRKESEKGEEHFVEIKNAYQNKSSLLSYDISLLKQASQYKGLRHNAVAGYKKKHFEFNWDANLMTSQEDQIQTEFFRNNIHTTYRLNVFKIGMEQHSEHNQWKSKNDHQLLSNSFANKTYKAYIKSTETSLNQFETYYQYRKDLLPWENKLSSQSESEDIGFSLWLKKNKKNQLKLGSNYRKLRILNQDISQEKPEENFLGKLEHRSRILKGLIQTSTYYELGSGLEADRIYSYLEVNAGQGVYKWTDYNKNEIKEINEFEIASFKDEANYIRISNITTQYRKVYTSEYRQSLNIQLKRLKGQSWFLRFASAFNNRFSYRIAKKSTDKDFNLYGNPFSSSENKNSIINQTSSLQNTLSFHPNKSNTSYDYIYLNNAGKLLLNNGFEKNKLSQNSLRLVWRKQNWQISNRADIGHKTRSSEVFSSKDFKLDILKNELKLKYQLGRNFQLGFEYLFKNKENKLNIEKLKSHDFGLDAQLSPGNKKNLNASVHYLSLKYNSDNNSSIAYEMLEGFLPGNNMTWSLNYQQQLSKTFQMNINYRGRQSEGNSAIHVGSMELRAYF
ncbi:hypothetical protein EO244_10975 [Ancylomarina salipaludis]|uniref:DUF2460 domain-containing protein n=1 Tax=Ancylomarina salipaludis TaxID=2501299 RepID=A0A4V1N007_9BACT|nr:hypothetical protein [Ancylomarina salipaludis]RXQ92988.1 hypothetical protein EO244_10975 [Ancylomarina salipaludis]